MPKTKVKAKAKAKGRKQIEDEADKARKAKVDADNKKKAAKQAKKEAAEALEPLTAEESAFLKEMAPKMNEGTAARQPSSAEMLRYSQLIGRKGVKKAAE